MKTHPKSLSFRYQKRVAAAGIYCNVLLVGAGSASKGDSKMATVTTRNLQPGHVIVIYGEESVVTSKSKAWKAPEYFINFIRNDLEMRANFHSNKKWTLVEQVTA
jgi:hypothetical protein